MYSRIRVTTLLLKEDKILLVRMHRPDTPKKDIFVLPGGGLEAGEGIIECAIREVKEETNLDVEISKILYLKDLISKQAHSLEIICLGKIVGGSLETGTDPEASERFVLKDVAWMDIGSFAQLNFHPKQLKTILYDDFKKGFDGLQYLGKFQYPEAD